MKVIFFDIDGTLITTGGAGRIAMGEAFRQVIGVCDQVEGVPFSGRTDRAIARDLFRAHDVEETPELWARFRSAYLELLPKALQENRGSVLPGVAAMLQRLTSIPRTGVGLLTGNLKEGARLKLGHYKLFDRFRFGGFGDDHHHRDDVAREALIAAQKELGAVSADDIWVIGDTAHDVVCARAIGARVIAVRTGFAEPGELEASKPDVLIDDLTQLADDDPIWN